MRCARDFLITPVLALALTLGALPARAASDSGSWRAMGAFTAVSSADAPALSRWYRETLGFEALAEDEIADPGIRYALLRRGDCLVEIVQRPEATAPAPDANGRRETWRTHGYFKFGLVVDDLEGLEARLRAQGVRFNHSIVQPKDSPWRTFAVRDPEGNVLQFFGK